MMAATLRGPQGLPMKRYDARNVSIHYLSTGNAFVIKERTPETGRGRRGRLGTPGIFSKQSCGHLRGSVGAQRKQN